MVAPVGQPTIIIVNVRPAITGDHPRDQNSTRWAVAEPQIVFVIRGAHHGRDAFVVDVLKGCLRTLG